MRKKRKLIVKILKIISLGALISASFVCPNLPKALLPLIRKLAKDVDAPIKSVRYSLKSLKRNRLVQVKEQNGEMILVLTKKGKEIILRGNLDEMTLVKPDKWDGLWRIVIFDIPDKHKQAREALRNKFNELGFYCLQKSCYIYPFECKKEIDFISEVFNVAPYIIYIVAKDIEGRENLVSFFDL